MKESIGRKILNKHNDYLGRKQQKNAQQLGRHQLDAQMSKDAYEKKRQDLGDWMIEKYHNNREHAVYINNKLKEIKVAFRGTDNLADVKTDFSLAFGKLKNTDRFKRENNLVEQLKRMFIMMMCKEVSKFPKSHNQIILALPFVIWELCPDKK